MEIKVNNKLISISIAILIVILIVIFKILAFNYSQKEKIKDLDKGKQLLETKIHLLENIVKLNALTRKKYTDSSLLINTIINKDIRKIQQDKLDLVKILIKDKSLNIDSVFIMLKSKYVEDSIFNINSKQ